MGRGRLNSTSGLNLPYGFQVALLADAALQIGLVGGGMGCCGVVWCCRSLQLTRLLDAMPHVACLLA